MRNFIVAKIFVVAVLLSGCAGMPGSVTTRTSEFDKALEVVLEPGHVPSSGTAGIYISLGAYWSSKNPDIVQLVASTLHNPVIQAKDGLQFNIDDKIIKLSSPHFLTERKRRSMGGTAAYIEARRSFIAPFSVVEKLVHSEGVKVKLLVGQSEYYEGELQRKGMSSAYAGLRDFMAEVQQTRSSKK